MPRQNTRIESEGAEFLVLGNLLIQGLAAYKSYTYMPGYDIVVTFPEKNLAAKIQVKSRWRTKANGFIIKNFDCDFVVIVLLNRGLKDGTGEVLPPVFYIVPTKIVKTFHRTENWNKVTFSREIREILFQYKDRWDLISDFPNAYLLKLKKAN